MLSPACGRKPVYPTHDTTLDRDAGHRTELVALLGARGRVGGVAVWVNVVDPASLQAAQADPEAYGNLLVRVTGYNACFVMLGEGIQGEIIAREAHAN